MNAEFFELKLFPLGVVLFPGIPLPLHIFEERYKKLIGECLEKSSVFGIVYYDGTAMRSVGCTARVEHIAKRYDDGRLDIVVRGERRFRIDEILEKEPIVTARGGFLPDREGQRESIPKLIQQSLVQLDRLAEITHSTIDTEALRELDSSKVSYILASLDVFSPEEKQHFLEHPTTSQRLLGCLQSLAGVVKTYDIAKTVKKLFPEGGSLLHRFN